MARPSAADMRAARRVARAYALAVRAVERRFVVDVRGIMRGVHELMERRLESIGRDLAGDSGTTRRDASAAGEISAVTRSVVKQIGPKVRRSHVKMQQGLERAYNSNMRRVIPVAWKKLPPEVQEAARKARNASVELVENAAREYAQQVRDIFGDPEKTHGKRWEELRDMLLERGGVSESRAELIARDQTLKLNGAINQANQEAAGLQTYTWQTSGDERVRAEHEELDGTIQAWASPPEPGHPGEDFQCRCIAIPVIPELADWVDGP